MIVSGERVARFVSQRLGFGLCPPYAAIGIEYDGQVVGGALLNCFEGADVQVSVAGKGWSPDFLTAIGAYVYGQLGCERMTIKTESPVVARIGEKMGGLREGLLRNHFGPGRDAVIVGILRDEYKYATVKRRLNTTSRSEKEDVEVGQHTQGSGSDGDGAGPIRPEHRYGADPAARQHGGHVESVG